MPAHKKKKKTLTELRHPLYSAHAGLWLKWRLCYEGAEAFKEAFLYRYSKREDDTDFTNRKKITYIPGHSRAVINIIRNALAVRLPDVVRKGSQEYLDAMQNDVDGFNSSMTAFVALDITPLLIVQGKRFVVVDAIPSKEGATKAEDLGTPYFYTVDAEDVVSWAYSPDGDLIAILMHLHEDVVNAETGLIEGSQLIYRYMRRLEDGEEYTGACSVTFTGPGVVIASFDVEGKLLTRENACQFLEMDRIPVVEFSLVSSIMAEIADHQISLLNLASTDMDFLWRGNFPIYTEQQPKKSSSIRPRGTKRRKADEDTDSESVLAGSDPGTGPSSSQRRVGSGKGVGYMEDMDRPDFISPGTENLKVSMTKQEGIAKEIRILVDLALVSLSVKALEQSGKSKEADRVGEEAGLAYIGQALESGERELGQIFEMMAGNDPNDIEVNYPESYSIRTASERRTEAEELRKLHSAVRSETYQRTLDKRVAEVLLKPLISADELEKVFKEIDAGAYVDDDKDRSQVIQKDVVTKIVSRGTAATLRGYDADEAEKVRSDAASDVSALLGGSEGAPTAGDADGSAGDEGAQ
jgi:hypothetical protein